MSVNVSVRLTSASLRGGESARATGESLSDRLDAIKAITGESLDDRVVSRQQNS